MLGRMRRWQGRPLALSALVGRGRSVAEAGVPVLDRPITFRRSIMRSPVVLGRHIRRLASPAKLHEIHKPVLEALGVILRKFPAWLAFLHLLPVRGSQFLIPAMFYSVGGRQLRLIGEIVDSIIAQLATCCRHA